MTRGIVRWSGRLVVPVVVTALVLGSAAMARADEPSAPEEPPAPPPSVAWTRASASGPIGTQVTLTGAAADLPQGATVRLQRLGKDWTNTGGLGVDGPRLTVRLRTAVDPIRLRLQAVDAAGTVLATSGAATVTGTRIATSLRLQSPSRVVDYRKARFVASWKAAHGPAPTGSVRLEFRKAGTKTWRKARTISVRNGTGAVAFAPRNDGRYRLRFAGTRTYAKATSATRALDNLPPGTRVVLPRGAPRPSSLPAQPRASRKAADAKISKLSDSVWKSMKGRSWHSGCPVGRKDLRIVRVNYWAFDGYVRRGEIVVHRKVAGKTARAFTAMFKGKHPIRNMYRVDRFGWSKSLQGADDRKSMRADNTSGFNCRKVVGRSVRSPHAYGRAIDVNPWENPFHSSGGWVPNRWFVTHASPARVTWRSSSDPVVKLMRKHGFRWSYGRSDMHHFDG
ncbi:M15 family metallopeptidase [Aeromicrobium duanguangcaii]|uniref:M15 family metallopeptidase n=1 Tax=Aeromicrobium duanguangcaii TaxID=2968086 RepID=UPI0020180D92|nr:M15 family metallopeptidase [Aeromicrobium duanguangcaii]